LGPPNYDLWFLPLGRILIIFFFTKKNQNQFQSKTSFGYLNQTLPFFALGEF
jgi:hypothetical protein